MIRFQSNRQDVERKHLKLVESISPSINVTICGLLYVVVGGK